MEVEGAGSGLQLLVLCIRIKAFEKASIIVVAFILEYNKGSSCH